ncbi:2-phospho-L-lactate guanylyltransferase [Streptomyces sp. TRM70308]|uniref:2-phospho-L-lactate guanylyltransferase n=1 Tax=Streptomyces sp. TRM70308 TaxID=3131932 RepID=UPI003D043896
MLGETTSGARAGWSLLVPLKPLERAKSRLSTTSGEALRPRLALAFALDTVSAALACPLVRDVVVVTNDRRARRELAALGARVLPDVPDDGLNAALAHGAATLRARSPRAAVAALNADLPALRTVELTRVLGAAAQFPRAFLPDAAGIGTTFLSAGPARELAPAFGADSRRRHRASGARELALRGVDSVRRDVDTGADLAAARALGLGRYTLTVSAASPA